MRSYLRTPALCALYGALSVFFCWPLFEHPLALGVNDWDQHLFYYGSVLKNVVEYGQPPFWSPWYCGGNVLWQNPQIALLSPVYPLTLAMPIQLAMKVNIVLHYWIGFVGMHVLLTRIIGLRFLPAVIYFSTLVVASGTFAIHFRAGHSNFLPGFYLPLQLYFLFRAFKTGSWRDACISAAILALVIFNGGPHILPMAFAAIGAFTVFAAILKRDWRPPAIAALFVAAALAYSAPKLLPITLFVAGERFWDTRNPTERPDLVTAGILYQTYLVPTRNVGGRLPMQRHGWHEYGNYIGIPGVMAIAGGLAWVFTRRRSPERWFGYSLALTSIVLFGLSLGDFSELSPAALTARLPLFSSFRIPSRYTMVFVQFAALASAWAMTGALDARGRRPWVPAALAIVFLGASAHLLANNRENFSTVFREPPFDTAFEFGGGPNEISTDAESSAYSPGSPMLRALMNDRAFFYCYESLQTFRTASPGRPRVFTLEGARVSGMTFTPNRIDFGLDESSVPTRVYLNTNWNEGWTSTAGPLDYASRDVMASVLIPPGPARRFSFSFTPPGLVAGTLIALVAVALSAMTWRKRVGD